MGVILEIKIFFISYPNHHTNLSYKFYVLFLIQFYPFLNTLKINKFTCIKSIKKWTILGQEIMNLINIFFCLCCIYVMLFAMMCLLRGREVSWLCWGWRKRNYHNKWTFTCLPIIKKNMRDDEITHINNIKQNRRLQRGKVKGR